MKLEQLNTERRNQNTIDIDRVDTLSVITKINTEDQKVPMVIQENLESIAEAIDYMWPSFEQGRLFYVGAGTSGRLGVIDAAECPPTFGVDYNKVIGLMAGGQEAMIKAREGVEDDRTLCQKDLEAYDFNEKDILMGIAASGRTPYTIGGLDYARSIGARTVSLSCVENAEMSKHADKAIEIVTGPEAITGSTRMKAGTAQKLVLNMISTTLMIKLGKIYSNLMVDVQPTNEKLVNRSKRIISEALSVSFDEAEKLFEASGKVVKGAIVMGLLDLDKDKATQLLQENNQRISDIIHTNK